ncbi:unnamed protein product [Prorocentrum cordatum]|uniref:Isochorismatase-like domain-containing protein n=1 Tax=Prorocentrum cordatum TaxID=2364126 RepID=A0ABN9RXL4_9DINO|nr:unnamed protein product [Polarella glacialis]
MQRFASGYAGLPHRHRPFGSLARLNSRQGDSAVHWLMEGYEGSEIEPSLAPETHDVMAWRQRLRPGGELLEPLRQRGISKVAVAGLKAGQSVLSVVQALADEGLLVYVPRECVADDDAGRRAAVLEHLLPQFGDVLGFEEFKRSIAEEMMMDAFVETRSMQPPAG